MFRLKALWFEHKGCFFKTRKAITKSDSLTRFSVAANDFKGKDGGPWYSAAGLFFSIHVFVLYIKFKVLSRLSFY